MDVELGLVRPYIDDCRGNFAMTLAFASMLISLVVGVGVDTNGAVRQARHLQNIADAAALAATKSLEDDPAKIKAIVADVVENNNSVMYGIESDVTVMEASIKVRLTAHYNTIILKSVGKPTIKTSVVSISPMINSDPINVALVLDTTASMAGPKMAALKNAANEFINTLERVNNDDIMISVVPFAHYISVPTKYRNAPWLKVPADYTQTFPPVCYSETYSDGTTYESCYTPDPVHWVWKGAIGTRPGGSATTGAKINPAFDDEPFPGILEPRNRRPIGATAINPPTKDYKSLSQTVRNLSAGGDAYTPSGLMWGWRTVSPTEPFDTVSANQSENTVNAIVLMTDGANQRSVTGPVHNGKDGKAADELSSKMCDEIKADGIVVYTVAYRFDPSGDNTKKMLQYCASKPENFIEARNSADLKFAFKRIAVALYTSRISG